MPISVVLCDYGGVVAEEGFREGLREIARKQGVPPEDFFSAADRLISESGYLTGEAGERDFWEAVRQATGITGSDVALRSEIITRFTPRPEVIACVDVLRRRALPVFLLSDQTDWLEEIDRDTDIFAHFDGVYNSYRIHMSKRRAETFDAVCGMLGKAPGEVLFIDDNAGHVERAAGRGLNTILYTTFDDCCRKLKLLTGIACGA